jgi:hypothetical protein
MSFIRLLALSYLAWAAVFVVTVILVAHLPLPGNTPAATGARAHKIDNAAIQLPPGKPESHMVARLDLAPVAPFPSPTSNSDVLPPQPPVAQEPEPKPIQSPPVAAATPPVPPQPPAAKPEPRSVAQIGLAPAPVPVARPDASPAKPHVVNEAQNKPSLQQERVAASPEPPLPRTPERTRGPTHLASAQPAFHMPEPRQSVIAAPPIRPRPPALEPTPANRQPAPAKPAFHIPDPPPSSLANLPVHLQLAASQKRKRASVEPAFRIPDPPPLEAPIF